MALQEEIDFDLALKKFKPPFKAGYAPKSTLCCPIGHAPFKVKDFGSACKV